MNQTDARRHAKLLTEATGTIHVALTVSAMHGRWPAADDVWVILPVGAYPARRALTTVAEAVAKINRKPYDEHDDPPIGGTDTPE